MNVVLVLAIALFFVQQSPKALAVMAGDIIPNSHFGMDVDDSGLSDGYNHGIGNDLTIQTAGFINDNAGATPELALASDLACVDDWPTHSRQLYVLVTIVGNQIDALEGILATAYRNLLAQPERNCSGVFELVDLKIDSDFVDTTTVSNLNVPVIFNVTCHGYKCDQIEDPFLPIDPVNNSSNRRLAFDEKYNLHLDLTVDDNDEDISDGNQRMDQEKRNEYKQEKNENEYHGNEPEQIANKKALPFTSLRKSIDARGIRKSNESSTDSMLHTTSSTTVRGLQATKRAKDPMFNQPFKKVSDGNGSYTIVYGDSRTSSPTVVLPSASMVPSLSPSDGNMQKDPFMSPSAVPSTSTSGSATPVSHMPSEPPSPLTNTMPDASTTPSAFPSRSMSPSSSGIPTALPSAMTNVAPDSTVSPSMSPFAPTFSISPTDVSNDYPSIAPNLSTSPSVDGTKGGGGSSASPSSFAPSDILSLSSSPTLGMDNQPDTLQPSTSSAPISSSTPTGGNVTTDDSSKSPSSDGNGGNLGDDNESPSMSPSMSDSNSTNSSAMPSNAPIFSAPSDVSAAPSSSPSIDDGKSIVNEVRYCGCKLPSRDNLREEFLRLAVSVQQQVEISRLTPLEQVDCGSALLETFRTHVVMLVRANITNNSDLTSADHDTLARAAQESYNQENKFQPNSCDTTFVMTTNVRVVLSPVFDLGLLDADRRRKLLSDIQYMYVYVEFSGTCRGCREIVFRNTISDRRRLSGVEPGMGAHSNIDNQPFKNGEYMISAQSLDASFVDQNRSLVLNDANGTCYCPQDAPNRRKPDRSEFRDRMRSTIRGLRDGGRFDWIEDVKEVVEVKEQPCPSNQTVKTVDIGMAVLTKLNGTVDPSDEPHVHIVLSNAIMSTYNVESLNYCDDRFRQIVAVDPAPLPTVDPLVGFSPAYPPSDRKDYFKVTFEYFGDNDIVNPFADNRRRRDRTRKLKIERSGEDSISVPSSHVLRDLQTNSTTCFCSTTAQSGVVDVATFEIALGSAISLAQLGALNGIAHVELYGL